MVSLYLFCFSKVNFLHEFGNMGFQAMTFYLTSLPILNPSYKADIEMGTNSSSAPLFPLPSKLFTRASSDFRSYISYKKTSAEYQMQPCLEAKTKMSPKLLKYPSTESGERMTTLCFTE